MSVKISRYSDLIVACAITRMDRTDIGRTSSPGVQKSPQLGVACTVYSIASYIATSNVWQREPATTVSR